MRTMAFRAALLVERWRFTNKREKLLMWIAWKIPKSIAYWVFVRCATQTKEPYPAERTCLQVMKDIEDWQKR